MGGGVRERKNWAPPSSHAPLVPKLRYLCQVPNWLKSLAHGAVILLAVCFLGPVLLAIAVPLALWDLVRTGWFRLRAPGRFRTEFPGRDLLLVTSNSPRWQVYIEENWLPRWGQRAVVINWSERNQWGLTRYAGSAEQLFRAFRGSDEFNPLAIVVPPRGRRVRIVRFYQAFRDRKAGKLALLEKREAELAALLAENGSFERSGEC